MRRTLFLVSAGLLAMGGCSQKPRLECGSDSATSATISLVKDQLQKSISDALNSSTGSPQILQSRIRATIDQIKMSLEDIRTAKVDPNSTKKFCTAKFNFVVSTSLLDDAEKARSDGSLTTIAKLSDDQGVEENANSFSSSLDYDVQPTDDGQKVYAESDDLGKIKGFYGELVASALAKGAVEQAREQAQTATDAQAAQQQGALSEQKAADQAQAKTENQLATQTIAAVWKNIDPGKRQYLLEDERNWIRKKNADCAVEAASASVDPTEQETARLRCDTKATQARISYLQGMPQDSPPPPPPPPSQSPDD